MYSVELKRIFVRSIRLLLCFNRAQPIIPPKPYIHVSNKSKKVDSLFPQSRIFAFSAESHFRHV